MDDDSTIDTVLLEQRSDDPVSGPYIRRLAPDGTYSEFSSVMVSFENGQLVTTEVEPAWREMEQLSTEQVARVETSVRDHFFDLDEAYEPPGKVSDGWVVTWRACLDDTARTVELRSVDVSEIPGLAEVSEVFETVLAEAAERAGERSRDE